MPRCVFLMRGLSDTYVFASITDTPLVLSSIVIFDRCDKRFVHMWMRNRGVFPHMKTLVLRSHPCTPEIVHWMKTQHHLDIYVSDIYWSYLERWGVVPEHMHKIKD